MYIVYNKHMQTFLPFSNFKKSAEVLDMKRLGKQRVETYQLMKALLIPEYGWKNHPAAKMWKGYELALLRYQEAICKEWSSHGYRDTCLEKTTDLYFSTGRHESLAMPPWLGKPEIHASHRSNLLKKKPDWYAQFEWNESDDLPYVWPVN